MIFSDIVLLYILAALAAIVLAFSIKRIAKVRVWIKTGKAMNEIGYLQFDDSGAAGEVKLSGSGNKAPIARVSVDGTSKKAHGHVELITTDIEDDSVKPSYRNVGYIGFDDAVVDEYGIIYKQTKGKRREKIGYTARPSKPNTPTIYGERSWKTLWLVCTLNAYYGNPNPKADEEAEKAKKAKKSKKDEKGKDNKNKEPEGKTPDTKTPEGKTPETKTPEGKTPDTKTPEGKTPETPDTKAPETKAPETPEAKTPETPEAKAPETPDATDAKTPETPDAKTPETPINGLKIMNINANAEKPITENVDEKPADQPEATAATDSEEDKNAVVENPEEASAQPEDNAAAEETAEDPEDETAAEETAEDSEDESADEETDEDPEDETADEETDEDPEDESAADENAEGTESAETEGAAKPETENASQAEADDSGKKAEEAPKQTPEETPKETAPVDPFAALSAEEKQRLDSVKKTYPKMLASFISNMVKVEGGSFFMGNNPQDDTTVDDDGKKRGKVEENESPRHKVNLDTYYIAKYPVTQAEWKAVMGFNQSDCQDDPKYPVAPISWNKAQDFILRLSYLTGITFQLPTEAQWEYAARGGKKTKGFTFSGSNKFSEVGFTDHKHAVGQKGANELGIHDMSGLVREWCSDFYGHYTEDEQTNPTGPAEDSELIVLNEKGKLCHVVRSPYDNETVSNRKGEDADLELGHKSYGFRVVCTSLPTPPKKDDQQKKPAVTPAPETQDKSMPKTPAAICHFTGLHRSKKDRLPAEARACAYALLSQKFPTKSYSEYYKDRPYGWLDTALLTTIIFSILYIIVYIFNTGILQLPLLGNDILAVGILIIFYYLLWALVRFIKIDGIENSNSFQPRLDMLNKNLGMGFMNWSILLLGALAIYFTMEYYDYDFIPLIWAIMSGVGFNMMLKSANQRWIISSTYNENDNDEDEDEQEIKNPEGDIAKTYDWDLDSKYSSQKVHGNLTLYFYANDIKDIRQLNPFFAQRKDKNDEVYILEMFHFLKDHRTFMARVRYISSVIDHIVEKQALTPIDRIQFALDFVQEPNIQFVENKDCKTINSYDDYIRYPDETLYDREGDSNSKSLLAAMIFHTMGFNVLYLISRKHQHSAVGIEIKQEDLEKGWYGNMDKLQNSIIEEGGKKFIFCETTGDRFAIGSTIKDVSVEDFERKVLLPATEQDDEPEPEDEDDETITRMYNWDLEQGYEHKVHGTMTLDFTEKEMKTLRESNPFQTYGQDAHTYEDNIRTIFAYVTADESHISRVKAITDYIRKVAEENKLSSLETAQFALDFAQAPNINYEIDEKSAGIDCAKEYMRFPDEVLFDKEGDCDCKSSLTAALFHSLGYNVIIMLSTEIGHAAIGIEAEEEWLSKIEHDETVLREYNGKNYLYCETTGDGFRIGCIKENDSIQKFEKIVEVPA